MRVLDLIPNGKANAIKRKTLVHMAFCNGLIPEDVKDADRFVRKEIERERKHNVIINLGTGYFVPTADEHEDKEENKEEPKQKKRKSPVKIDWDKACALKLAGWSNKDIAAELHANKGTIDTAIYKHLIEYQDGKREGRCEEIEETEV